MSNIRLTLLMDSPLYLASYYWNNTLKPNTFKIRTSVETGRGSDRRGRMLFVLQMLRCHFHGTFTQSVEMFASCKLYCQEI